MTTDLEKAVIRSYQGGRCVACHAQAMQADHFKPRHASGPDIPENLVGLCDRCNKLKSCLWPRHGYHPVPGYGDLAAATIVLVRELDYLSGVYGESHLIAAIGAELDEVITCQLEMRARGQNGHPPPHVVVTLAQGMLRGWDYP